MFAALLCEVFMYDMVIVGGGPAGLTAALYGLRNGKTVAVVEKSVFGGQITNSPKVENIPGFPSISGDEFADIYLDQVMGQGAEVFLDEAVAFRNEDGVFTVELEMGEALCGRTLILATGTKHRLLGLPGEEDLIGGGISFCAVCDGDFYEGKDVCMIGGGNSAFVESSLLVNIVNKLIILQDMPFFTGEQKLQDQVLGSPNVEAHTGTRVLAYETEDGQLTGVRYLDQDGSEQVVSCDGVFLAIGLVPDNGPYAELAQLDARGYFDADESCRTKTPGVFVAGDCRAKTLRQVATACSDGAVAAIAACNYLNGLA